LSVQKKEDRLGAKKVPLKTWWVWEEKLRFGKRGMGGNHFKPKGRL